MVITVDKFIDRYPCGNDVLEVISVNPILYRFVLPKPYFGPPSGEVTSQMPGESRVDGYDLRNQAVLDRIATERELRLRRKTTSK